MQPSVQSRPTLLPDPFCVLVRRLGTTSTIELSGELDLAGRDGLLAAVLTALDRRPERLVLDLSGLSFIDSSGVHLAIEIAERSERQSTGLVIIPGPPTVHRIFDLGAVTPRLPFVNLR